MRDGSKEITLLVYRIAIGPVLLLMVGWIWSQQREISDLRTQNTALFETTAQLEAFAREASKQRHYLDGLKDTLLAGANRPQSYVIRLEAPSGTLAAAEDDWELPDDLWDVAPAPDEGVEEPSNPAQQQPPPQQQQQQQQQAEQLPYPDYDHLPEIDERQLQRYREQKTAGARK